MSNLLNSSTLDKYESLNNFQSYLIEEPLNTVRSNNNKLTINDFWLMSHKNKDNPNINKFNSFSDFYNLIIKEKDNNIDTTKTYWFDIETTQSSVVSEIFQLFSVNDNICCLYNECKSTSHYHITYEEDYTAFNIEVPLLEQFPTISEIINSNIYKPIPENKRNYGLCTIILKNNWIISIHKPGMKGITSAKNQIEKCFSLNLKSINNKSLDIKSFKSKENKDDPTNFTMFKDFLSLTQSKSNNFDNESIYSVPSIETTNKSVSNCSKAIKLSDKQFTSNLILAMLIDELITCSIPDIPKCVEDANKCENMALSSTLTNQRDILNSICLMRRTIGDYHLHIYYNMDLLQKIISNDLDFQSIALDNYTKNVYKTCIGKLENTEQRLKCILETLSSASGNLAAIIDLHSSEISNQINALMRLLSQINAICLPINLIASIYGMNCQVPLQSSDDYTNLTPFWSFMTLFAFYLILWIPYIVKTNFTNQNLKITDEDNID